MTEDIRFALPGLAVAIVGPFGPAQLTCIRSWSRCGFRVFYVHVTEASGHVPLLEGLVSGYLRLRAAELASAHGGAALTRFVSTSAIKGVAALSYDLIARLHELSREDSWPEGARIWTVPAGTLPLLKSKSRQLDLARQCGLLVPETWRVGKSDWDGLQAEAFPLVLRPDGPDSVAPDFKVQWIESQGDLRAFVEKCTRLDAPLVGQRFIEGTNLVVHGARSAGSGESLHVGFEVLDLLDGVSVSLSRTELPAEVVEGCERFAERAGLCGVYHFDFRKSGEDGRCYFLEVNGRLGGTTGKVYRLGFDEPLLMANAFEGGSLTADQCDEGATAANRYAIAQSMLRVARGRLTVFDYPRWSPSRHLVRLGIGLLCWRDELFRLSQARSSLAFFLERFVR